MERFLNYFSDWKTRSFECPDCGWRGSGEQAAFGMYATFMDLVCPRNELHTTLAIINYPSVDEMRLHADIPWVREQLERDGFLGHSVKLLPN